MNKSRGRAFQAEATLTQRLPKYSSSKPSAKVRRQVSEKQQGSPCACRAVSKQQDDGMAGTQGQIRRVLLGLGVFLRHPPVK